MSTIDYYAETKMLIVNDNVYDMDSNENIKNHDILSFSVAYQGLGGDCLVAMDLNEN